MEAQASPAELPELQTVLGAFRVRFRRPEGREAQKRYTTGPLTELPNKNCDTIAQALPGTSEQRLQEFLTHIQWDEEYLNRERVRKMITEVTRARGGWYSTIGAFPSRGRPWSGSSGSIRGRWAKWATARSR